MQETELYGPIKAMLEAQGYEVKSEIQDCDLVAQRGDEAPVIVELKRNLSLALLCQGVDRLAISDAVYVAVPAGKGKRWRVQVKDVMRLCRRLGLGLMSVRFASSPPLVEVHLDPGAYQPRKSAKRQGALLREFQRRVGDPNVGGQVRRKIITAYRQDALRIARHLARAGSASPAQLRAELDIANAGAILQSDHYGWFERVSRGIYQLRTEGEVALKTYQDIVKGL